jgi:hypothetical protein
LPRKSLTGILFYHSLHQSAKIWYNDMYREIVILTDFAARGTHGDCTWSGHFLLVEASTGFGHKMEGVQSTRYGREGPSIGRGQ